MRVDHLTSLSGLSWDQVVLLGLQSGEKPDQLMRIHISGWPAHIVCQLESLLLALALVPPYKGFPPQCCLSVLHAMAAGLFTVKDTRDGTSTALSL